MYWPSFDYPLQWTLRSPLRPDEVESLKAAYSGRIDWLEDQYAELSAFEIEGSLSRVALTDGRVWRSESAGWGCGRDIESMHELAVS
jgi:hypothetical protein